MTEPTTLLETYIIRCGDAPAANGKIIEWKTAMDALDRLRRIEELVRPAHASPYHRSMVPDCAICAALEEADRRQRPSPSLVGTACPTTAPITARSPATCRSAST